MNVLADLDGYGNRLFGQWAAGFQEGAPASLLLDRVKGDYRTVSNSRRHRKASAENRRESLALMAWYGVLLSAIHTAMGEYDDAKGWSQRAQAWGKLTGNLSARANAFAQEATLEIWYGTPERARDAAVHGLQTLTRSNQHNTRARLSGQLMVAYASMGSRDQFEIAEEQFCNLTERASSFMQPSAFVWLPEQSWNARALAHAYMGDGAAIGLYEEAEKAYRRQTTALHPRYMARLNKAHAAAPTEPHQATEWALDVLRATTKPERASDRIYRDRAAATLSALPEGYSGRNAVELASVVRGSYPPSNRPVPEAANLPRR